MPGVIASLLFILDGEWWWLLGSGLATAGTFWTLGVMHNYAVSAAAKRSSYKGGFGDFTDEEVDAVPNGLAIANFLSSIACIVFFVCAIWVF